MASGRPAFGSRFNTGNIEPALLARGFHYGSAPGSVVIGWNGGHAAVTLPDGTPVSSGESGSGVRVGGGGAYQSQFSHHMYLPVQAQRMDTAAEAAPAPESAPAEAAAPPVDAAPFPDGPPVEGAVIELTSAQPPADAVPGPVEVPAPDEVPVPAEAPAAPADPALPLPA